jgi:hypothetical protein
MHSRFHTIRLSAREGGEAFALDASGAVSQRGMVWRAHAKQAGAARSSTACSSLSSSRSDCAASQSLAQGSAEAAVTGSRRTSIKVS